METEETTQILIAGTLNATNKMYFWKNHSGFWSTTNAGDYAIVENLNGYDLIKIAGIVVTTREDASKFANTSFEKMKKVITIISKEEIEDS